MLSQYNALVFFIVVSFNLASSSIVGFIKHSTTNCDLCVPSSNSGTKFGGGETDNTMCLKTSTTSMFSSFNNEPKPYGFDSEAYGSFIYSDSGNQALNKQKKNGRSCVVNTSINYDTVKTVRNMDEFYDCFEVGNFPESGEKDEEKNVVVVRFFSHMCKSCKAILPKYNRLARNNHKKAMFIDVPVTRDNIDLQNVLGLVAVPYGHIYYVKPSFSNKIKTRGYHGYDLVEELKMGKNHWTEFEEILCSYLNGYCNVAETNCTDPYVARGSTIRKKFQLME